MATPIRWQTIAAPELDTSGLTAASKQFTDAFGNFGSNVDNLATGIRDNFAVRQQNAIRDFDRQMRQEQEAARLSTNQSIQDRVAGNTVGTTVDAAGNLIHTDPLTNAQLSADDANILRIQNELGIRPTIPEQFAKGATQSVNVPQESNIFNSVSEQFPLAGTEIHRGPVIGGEERLSPEKLQENQQIQAQNQARAAALKAEGFTDEEIQEQVSPTTPGNDIQQYFDPKEITELKISPDQRIARQGEIDAATKAAGLYDAGVKRIFQDIRGEREDERQIIARDVQAIRDTGGTMTSDQKTRALQSFVDNDPNLQNISDEVLDKNKQKIIDREIKRNTLSAENQALVDTQNAAETRRVNTTKEIAQRNHDAFLAENRTSTPVSDSDNIVAVGAVMDKMKETFPEDKVLGFLTDTEGDSAGADLHGRITRTLREKYTYTDPVTKKEVTVPYNASMVEAAMNTIRTDQGFLDGWDHKKFTQVLDDHMSTYVKEKDVRAKVLAAENKHSRQTLNLDEGLLRTQTKNVAAMKANQGIFRVGDVQARARPGVTGAGVQFDPKDVFAREAAVANRDNPQQQQQQPIAVTGSLNSSSSVQDIQAGITAAATSYGLDPATMLTIFDLESNFDPNARPGINPKTGERASSAKGLGQITDGTMKGLGGGDPFDPNVNIDATMRLAIENVERAKRDLGPEYQPVPSDVYLFHQQNPTVVMSMLANPNDKAVDHVATRKAIANNLPKITGESAAARKSRINNMTTSEFLDIWRNKFDSKYKKYS